MAAVLTTEKEGNYCGQLSRATYIVIMEYKREAAVRAKEIAEKKFEERDIAGAKRFALKAQSLNPELDGLPQLIATLDVYISAEKSTNEEVDWYSVLGVDPLADEPTIRNHYRRLALLIHPDRNKSVGADGAFKILSEAWSLLSEKGSRFLYDQRRQFRILSASVSDRKSTMSSGQNGFHNLFNRNDSHGRDYKGAAYPRPSSASPCPIKPTFWTMCGACKTYFEYLRNYLENNLVCPNCREPFRAFEMPPPPIEGHTASQSWASYMQQRNSSQFTMNKNSRAPERIPSSTTNVGLAGFSGDTSKKTFQAGLYSDVGSAKSMRTMASGSAQAAGGIHSACGRLKRKCEETSLDPLREEVIKTSCQVLKNAGGGLNAGSVCVGLSTVSRGDRPQKRRPMNDQKMSNTVGIGNGLTSLETMLGSQKVSVGTRRLNIAANCKINCTRELSLLEVRNMLKEKAKKVIIEKLKEWRMADASKVPYKLKDVRENENGKKEAVKPVVKANVKPAVKADISKCREHVDSKEEEHTAVTPPVKSDVTPNADRPDPVSMSVPDPDFYDFDKNRTEGSFGSNQIWAAYDEDDGMPRYYAMVHRLMSVEPFKMKISWLNFKGNDELAPLNWVASGFFKTTGDFRIGKHEVYGTLNSFSHQVKWTKGTRGTIQIYPTKGEVWALYKNWSPDWNELTPDEVIHKYDMVEVLEDYNEERGVTVVPLVKVAGFKTVFRQHGDTSKIRTIPREQMFRFSHQVPSYLLTGNEGQNAPKDCLELDPAATPLELLQVTTEVQKAEMVETAEKTKGGDSVERLERPKIQDLVENKKTAIGKGLVQDSEKEVAAEVTKREKETKGQWVVYSRKRRREGKRLKGAHLLSN